MERKKQREETEGKRRQTKETEWRDRRPPVEGRNRGGERGGTERGEYL
jgi:hypothetical protein